MMKKQKHSGFTLPEGYFESFNEKLSESLRDKEAHLPDDDGFALPTGYFETFNDRLRERLAPSDTGVVSLNYTKYLLVAATVAAVAVLVFLLPEKGGMQTGFEDLQGTDIVAYMDEGELELTDDEIAQLLPIDELEMNDMLTNGLNDENIMEYLDNSMDENDELNLDTND